MLELYVALYKGRIITLVISGIVLQIVGLSAILILNDILVYVGYVLNGMAFGCFGFSLVAYYKYCKAKKLLDYSEALQIVDMDGDKDNE